MARILVSYYKIQEVPLNKINCMWDGLFQELKNNGNDVFVINTAYFNSYAVNEVKNKKINSLILKKVKDFDPELIITFNHKIPQCILDNFKDVPTVIWDGDELPYFSGLDYMKENISRYKIFSIVKEWEKNYLEFGFDRSQVHMMPIATPIKALDIPQTINISFLGAYHHSSGKLNPILRSNTYQDIFPKVIDEYLNGSSYDYENLFKKHFKDSYDKLGLSEVDLFPLFNFRLITLVNLLDLGLQINGDRFDIITGVLPQLRAVYNSENIWTFKENEKYFNSSKISINPIHPQAKGSGFSWRVFDIMASNACLVCEQSSDLKELTQNYVDIPMYKTPWEARELCKELLVDDKARKEIVLASQRFIDETSRWVHRFKEMENILNIKLVNLDSQGSIYCLKDDEYFSSKDYLKSKNKSMTFKNKIRYKIWKHYNKVLKRKGII